LAGFNILVAILDAFRSLCRRLRKIGGIILRRFTKDLQCVSALFLDAGAWHDSNNPIPTTSQAKNMDGVDLAIEHIND
jgi:hypothetical protein